MNFQDIRTQIALAYDSSKHSQRQIAEMCDEALWAVVYWELFGLTIDGVTSLLAKQAESFLASR